MPITPPPSVPDLDILVRGSRLPLEARASVISVVVAEDIGVPSMFTIELGNWDQRLLRYTWSDSDLFAPGGEVEIWMGYVGSLERVMVGEITGLEPAFRADDVPTLTVRGYDHRHRLMRGRKTRSFVKTKDSQIAAQVAADAGLAARVGDSEIVLDYVLQHTQTDMAFLKERASRIGYEVFVRDKVLYFRSPPLDGLPESQMSLGADIIELYPRLSTTAQVGQVEVRGWDVRKKRLIRSLVRPDEVTSMRSGGTNGPLAGKRAFGAATDADSSWPVSSRAEADQLARGELNDIALAYVSAEGRCYGRPGLRAGTLVEIGGAGRTFSGAYYLTAVTHTLTAAGDYETEFSCRRNIA